VASGSAAHGDGVFECRFFVVVLSVPHRPRPSDATARARRPPPDEQVAAGKLDDTDSTLITIIHACHGLKKCELTTHCSLLLLRFLAASLTARSIFGTSFRILVSTMGIGKMGHGTISTMYCKYVAPFP
jgi:hypothetical protein